MYSQTKVNSFKEKRLGIKNRYIFKNMDELLELNEIILFVPRRLHIVD